MCITLSSYRSVQITCRMRSASYKGHAVQGPPRDHTFTATTSSGDRAPTLGAGGGPPLASARARGAPYQHLYHSAERAQGLRAFRHGNKPQKKKLNTSNSPHHGGATAGRALAEAAERQCVHARQTSTFRQLPGGAKIAAGRKRPWRSARHA